jgi:four helix bundle protein
MNADEMKKRTRAFALRIIRLVEALPNTRTADVIGKQLLRCGTSVGANYRASCRAKSQADFVAKMGIVEEEADETIYWIELLLELSLIEKNRVVNLLDEANQIVAIVVSSIKTARESKT